MRGIRTQTISRICITLFAIAAIVYIFGGLWVHARLKTIGAQKTKIEAISESCNNATCSATWSFVATHRFILLGQILRTHSLIETSSGKELFPVTAVTGTNSDSWVRLRVYEIKEGQAYQLRAIKPSVSKTDYFMGILPRETNDPGILIIPQVITNLTNISMILTITLLVFISCAQILSWGTNLSSIFDRNTNSATSAVSASFLCGAVAISSGIFDTLIPDGELRNRTLRASMAAAGFIFPFGFPSFINLRPNKFSIFTIACVAFTLAFLAWPILKITNFWASTIAIVSTLGTIKLLKGKHFASALLWSSGLFDAAKIAGIFHITDYPPVYLFNVLSLASLGLLAGESGGYAVISMAGEAYNRFKRDILLDSIRQVVSGPSSQDSSQKIYAIKSLLPSIADLFHANRISVTINLPLGRPITHLYDRHLQSSQIFDDGTIPGAVTMRTLLYGDSAIFENFEDFSRRINIKASQSLLTAKYFCAVPIKVNQHIVGSLMLTKFDDAAIERQIESGDGLLAEKETLKSVMSSIEQSLSSLMVQNLSALSDISRSLHKSLHQELVLCDRPETFLSMFARVLSHHCKADIVIHSKISNQGIAVAQCGLANDAWDFFCKNPLNLDPKSSSVGPTVVAFLDRKSSFIKDISEIKQRLHPKTLAIFETMDTESMAAIPLMSEERRFVVTLFRRRGARSADPGIVQVVESTEALFIAALEVMSQKSSVVALGELTSRLIGDADVRRKIIDAAKSRNLPTTIGSPKISFLLLFDLAGSSDLSQDTELKARAYGNFYDQVNRQAQALLNGSIRKTIGDAIIITWDGSHKDPASDPEFLNKLRLLTNYADSVARSIGCKGARALLHHGKYFLGLVGTDTFGQIDVIGSGIDEVCKMESQMKTIVIDGIPAKLAISESAAKMLGQSSDISFSFGNLTEIPSALPAKMRIRYACTLTTDTKGNPHVA